MAEKTKLNLERREQIGSNACRGLRKEGKTPVVIYGHGQETVPLAADTRQLSDVLAQRAQFLEVAIGDETETALIREVQYDVYGQDVVHVDLVRVDIDEPVVVSVPIELRGLRKVELWSHGRQGEAWAGLLEGSGDFEFSYRPLNPKPVVSGHAPLPPFPLKNSGMVLVAYGTESIRNWFRNKLIDLGGQSGKNYLLVG